MRTRYKFLIAILLLWIGMSYEGSRDATAPVPASRQYMTLAEQIRAYELGLIDGVDLDEADRALGPSGNRSSVVEDDYSGNLVARTGRNVGNALQTVVRELLRGIVRFFDGVIS